jgi:glycosyltransferase involved in cell wall biosynthesis
MSADQHRPRVTMLLSNPYEPDVRAQKEAHILALAGYQVTVIAWDRSLSYPQRDREEIPPQIAASLADWPGRAVDTPEPVSIVRIRKRAGWRQGPRHFLPRVPGFWWRLFRETQRVRPAVVHAHQLDTLPVAWAFGRLYGAPVVYDARENYPGMLAPSVGRLLAGALERLDRWLTPRAGAVLAVGERQAARHRAMGARVWIVHNSQPLADAEAAMVAGRAFRRSLGIPEAALLVVYVGNLSADRLLTPVLEAVPQLDDVYLVVGGDGPQAPEVRAAASACPRIRALGRVPLTDVSTIVAAGDVVYYGLNAENPNSFYFMPNLGFFALAVGRPLLVTPVGEIADIVRREACGLVMEAATAAAAEDALRRLRDGSLRARLAARARHLAETELNLTCAATRLLEAYTSVRSTVQTENASRIVG